MNLRPSLLIISAVINVLPSPGLAHKNDSLYVSNLYKQDYEVPFIMFSSDSIKRIEINEKQSAFNFMYGFTQWLGIKEKHLSGVDFFNPKEQKIKVFDWENIIDVNLLKDDNYRDVEADIPDVIAVFEEIMDKIEFE